MNPMNQNCRISPSKRRKSKNLIFKGSILVIFWVIFRSNKPKRKKIPNLTPTFQPQIPTYQPEITTKKPAQNRVRNRLRRQKLKQKIIEELQQLELEREDDLNQKLQFNLYNDISNNIMERRTSGFFNQITGDLSLSRKDFIFQLTTWFRRSIWFLGFTAAYTVSPTLLGIAVILSLLFELALNMDVIRNEMNAFMYDFSRRSEPFLNDPISTLTRLLYPEQPMYSNQYNYYNVF